MNPYRTNAKPPAPAAREYVDPWGARARHYPIVLASKVAVAAAMVASCFTLVPGCGATPSQALHDGLDATTDYADPLYAVAVVSCDVAEGEVITRHQPDEREAAAAALAQVRLQCDRIFAGFEEARALQLALRATAEAMEDGRATMSDVLRSADELALVVESTRALVTALRARIGGAQ